MKKIIFIGILMIESILIYGQNVKSFVSDSVSVGKGEKIKLESKISIKRQELTNGKFIFEGVVLEITIEYVNNKNKKESSHYYTTDKINDNLNCEEYYAIDNAGILYYIAICVDVFRGGGKFLSVGAGGINEYNSCLIYHHLK